MNGTAPYIGTSWNTMATIQGLDPSAITNVTGLIQGPNIATDTDPHVYFVSNSVDGLTRFYQFQTRDGNWFKTIDLEINYVEPLLRVRVPRAQYCSWSNVPGTGDEKFGYILTLDDAKAKGGKDYGVWGYCIHHVNVAFADHDAVFAATSALTGANSILSGRVDVEGSGRVKTCLVVSNAAALPPNGTLNVMSNGIVELAATGLSLYTGYQSGTCKMNVMRGGELSQTAATAVFGAESPTPRHIEWRRGEGSDLSAGGLLEGMPLDFVRRPDEQDRVWPHSYRRQRKRRRAQVPGRVRRAVGVQRRNDRLQQPAH